MTTLTYKPDTADVSNDIVARIARWFKKARPTPTISHLNTQLGAHFEEVSEMVETLTGSSVQTNVLLENAYEALTALADHLKVSKDAVTVLNDNRQDYLDSLADQIVTAVGSGVFLHLDITGALHEVSDSNDSKFDPTTGLPIFDPHTGKIMKGPAYRKADLSAFV